MLDLKEANFLRANGIVTVLNFVNGFTSWGGYAACYPKEKEPKDAMINVMRMFTFVSNTAVLTYWAKIDERMTPRYAAGIADGLNLWLAGLKTDDHILGGRVEYRADENPIADVKAGIVRLHIYIAPPGIAQDIEFFVEYDVSYINAAFGGEEAA